VDIQRKPFTNKLKGLHFAYFSEQVISTFAQVALKLSTVGEIIEKWLKVQPM
jgi:hypothetical protein